MSDPTANDPRQWPPPAGHQPPPQQFPPHQPPPQQPAAHPPQPGQWGPAPQPNAGLPGFGDPGPTTQESSVRTGPSLSRLGLIATVVVLAGLGGFALWRALDTPGGAPTPEEAAALVFEAAETEDLLGIIENMLPSERESMVEPLTDVMIELARLDVLSDDAVSGDQVNTPTGFTIEFPDAGQPGELVYEVEPLGTSETIQWVTVTDGQMTVTVDPAALRDGFGERIAEWIDAETTEADMEMQTETVDLGDDYANGEPIQFAVVEEDGSWYFSLWYTVAGFATDFEAPDMVTALRPVGADSPEQAATEFVTSLLEFELTGAMALLDPNEFRAAYDYWGGFGPELADAAASLRRDAAAEGLDWEVRSISASSEERNGRRVAVIDELTVGFASTADGVRADLAIGFSADGVAIDGNFEGEPVEVTIGRERASGRGSVEGERFEFDIDLLTYDGYAVLGPDRYDLVRNGDCLTVTVNNEETEEICDEELGTETFAALDFQEDYQAFIDDVGTPGLTVVERDGRWYVSGIPTYAYAAVDFLRAIDAEEFDEFLDSYEELIEDFGGTDF